MTNQDVMRAFLNFENAQTPLRDIINGYYSYKGRTLYTQNNGSEWQLINYKTPIAYIKDGICYLNQRKYSTTTSKIQTQLANLASQKFKIAEYYDKNNY